MNNSYINEKSSSKSNEKGEKIFLIEREVVNKLPDSINNIIFNWSILTGNGKNQSCIALGYGSLYNSSLLANMRYEAREDRLNILFIAETDILSGTELTINYSGYMGASYSGGGCWFD